MEDIEIQELLDLFTGRYKGDEKEKFIAFVRANSVATSDGFCDCWGMRDGVTGDEGDDAGG